MNVSEAASKVASKIFQHVIRERDKKFSRPDDKITKKDDPIEDLVRMAAAGIGVVSEAIHHQRDKKKSESRSETRQFQSQIRGIDSDPCDEVSPYDMYQEASMHQSNLESTKEQRNLAKAFIERCSSSPIANRDKRLALPVILPQRRPKTRSRGFIRAYAPVLDDMGIDRDTFLDFIDTINKALEPNPWLYAINLAGLAGLAVPHPFTFLVGIVASITTDFAMEAQSRFTSNNLLDHVNAEFFIPRQLICLVVTWKSDSCEEALLTRVDVEEQPTQAGLNSDLVQGMTDIVAQQPNNLGRRRRVQEKIQEMMKSSGGAYKSMGSALLVFPSWEQLPSTPGEGTGDKKKNALDRAEQWIDEYMDKRTQVQWMEKNSELEVANSLPRPEFRSRYADPNHPAASGDIVALLTGGRWQYGHTKLNKKQPSGENTDLEHEGDGKSLRPKKSKKTPKSDTETSQLVSLRGLLQKVRISPGCVRNLG
jgi:hypothetical protein